MDKQIWVKVISVFPVRYEGELYEPNTIIQVNEEDFNESVFEKVGEPEFQK